MSVLSVQSPYPIFTDTDGDPLESGYIWIGVANLDPQVNPLAVYWDAALTMPAVQPIRTLAGYPSQAGAPGRIYTNADHSIRVQNKRGTIVFTAGNVRDRFSADLIGYVGPDGLQYTVQDLADSSNVLTGDALIAVKSTLSGGVARTQHDKNADFVSVKDFGAIGNGINDDTASIQLAINNNSSVYFPDGTYLISSAITLSSNTTITGGSRANILCSNGNNNGFYASGKTRISISNIKIYFTSPGTTAYIGAIKLFNCQYCSINNIQIVGATWAGVLLHNSSHCVISKNSFSGWLGSQGDSSDICIYEDSNYNVITENNCFGGGDFGIFVQDPYTNTLPTGNIISNNQVGEHDGYGIIVYVTTAYNTKTVITGNNVRDILGTHVAGTSGAGIYIQSAGGTICSNNIVDNCCRSTTNFDTLGMAAISASTLEYGSGNSFPIIVEHNQIKAQRGPGIFAISSDKSVLINGNTIKSTGITAVRGEGIVAINAQQVKIINNTIEHSNTNYYAIRITCADKENSYLDVSGNNVRADGNGGIMINSSGAGFNSGSRVDGNTVWASTNIYAAFFQNCQTLRLSNNMFFTAGIPLYMTGCTASRVSGNFLKGTFIRLTGSMTGAIFCSDNNLLSGCYIQNDGGTIVEYYGNAAPFNANNTSAVGDRVVQSVPAVGQPKGWRCTVAGSPGTWVSEGNL